MAGRGLSICFAVFRSLPVVFITAVIVWSYYAYVFQLCLFTMQSDIEKIFCLIFYHPLLILMMWSYWKTIFTPVSLPPNEFYLSSDDLERFESDPAITSRREVLSHAARGLPLLCRTPTGEVRFCDKCKAIKPDRAHHCSVCSVCILKMDHHCPWVNNCIGHSNYKFFILFLGYALLYSLYSALTSLQYFISFWSGIGSGSTNMDKLHIVFLFFAGIMFAVSLLSLFGYHCFLVSKNRTTLESFQVPIFHSGPDKNGFNLGSRENFAEVFGSKIKFWFLPIFTSEGDGISYKTRMPTAANSYQAIESGAFSVQHADPSSHVDGLPRSVVCADDDRNNLLDGQQHWTNDGVESRVGFDNEVLNPRRS